MARTEKYCTQQSDIPKGDHFAIIEFTSVYIPGDERSRTNPGHGYPASTENYARYISYTDRTEWENEVKTRTTNRTPFVPLVVTRPVVETTISINIK